MGKSLGIHLTGRIVTGVIEGHKPCSRLFHFPEDTEDNDSLLDTPLDGLIELVREQAVRAVGDCGPIEAVGLALPGIVKAGVVEDAPNLAQLKGTRIAEKMHRALAEAGITAPVTVLNDADAMAAGVAAKHDRLDAFIRLWTLGYGIGFGRYPYAPGIWEGGHCVVTLDSTENYCGCGGRGHLEGIMGHRAMRLRFLDMEPEEVFAQAKTGDARCREFRAAVASRSGRGHCEFHSHARTGPLLLHRFQCPLSRHETATTLFASDGDHESAAELHVRNCSDE